MACSAWPKQAMQSILLQQADLLMTRMWKATQYFETSKDTNNTHIKRLQKQKNILFVFSCFIYFKPAICFFSTYLLFVCFHQGLFAMDSLWVLQQSTNLLFLKKYKIFFTEALNVLLVYIPAN